MTQIVLIRPGSTHYDDQGRIQGTLDIPLNDQGSLKAQQLGDDLRSLGISTIYSSPCHAAWQTASIIAEALDVKLKKAEELQNVDHGLWQGMLIDDVKRKHPKVFRQWQEQPEAVCPPEGETVGDAGERCKTFISKVLRKNKAATVALVASEPLASVIQSMLTGTPLGDIWKIGSTCGNWVVIDAQTDALPPRIAEVKGEKDAVPPSVLPIGLN
jgi:broad specificity phosphatase PhoE